MQYFSAKSEGQGHKIKLKLICKFIFFRRGYNHKVGSPVNLRHNNNKKKLSVLILDSSKAGGPCLIENVSYLLLLLFLLFIVIVRVLNANNVDMIRRRVPFTGLQVEMG